MASVTSPRVRPESAAPAAPSRSLLEHGWWPVVAWTCGLALGAGALSDNSFLTHLATGRLIRSTGAPHEDLFTFVSGGKPIVVQSWLASWIYATLDAIGGGTAIRLFIAAVSGALLLTLWRLSKPAGGLLARVGLVAMAGMVGLLWWNERPQILGFLALALIALVLQPRSGADEAERAGAGATEAVVSYRSPWWLVPLFTVWVNVHGSFPLGVAFVGAMIVVRVVSTRSIGRREGSEVAAVVLGLVIGALVSPYGFEMLTFPVELLGRSESLSLITEWKPLKIVHDGVVDTNNLVFAGEAIAICGLLVWRRSWLRLLVAAVFVGLAFMAVRNVAVAALVLIPLAAPALAGLGSPDPTVAPSRRRSLASGGIAAALVAAFIVATPAYDLSAYPVAAVDWMQAHGLVGRSDGDNARVLTHDYDGNYLEWRYGADANAWIDDRAELHPYGVVRDYVYLLSGLGDTDEILDRNPHDVVLWEADSDLGRHLLDDPAYEIIHRDRQAVVACRLGSSFC